MSDDFTKRVEEAYKERKCLSCSKTKDLVEIQIKDEEKTFICSGCLKALEKLLNKPNKRGMYNKLQAFLKAIPQQQEQVALNFSDFTDIMGHALPKTALNDRTWWANTESPQGNSWLSAGWKLENIYLHAKIVVFRRKAQNPLRNIPKYVKDILDGRTYHTHPPTQVLTGWIHFCRKVGWYFEGSILYERGGLTFDSLSETEKTEVEEDYAVCKRELSRYKNDNF